MVYADVLFIPDLLSTRENAGIENQQNGTPQNGDVVPVQNFYPTLPDPTMIADTTCPANWHYDNQWLTCLPNRDEDQATPTCADGYIWNRSAQYVSMYPSLRREDQQAYSFC